MVWASVGPTLHYIAISHTHCAEHGEIVHGGAAHEDSPFAESGAGPWIAGTEPAEDDHGHDHCPFAPVPRAQMLVAAANQSSRSAHPAPDAAPDACRRTHATIALFRLAPKQSPPA